MSKNDFKYLSQEFDNNVLDLVKQSDFILMSDFGELEEDLSSKKKVYNFLAGATISEKSMNMFLKLGINWRWKHWNIILTCT